MKYIITLFIIASCFSCSSKVEDYLKVEDLIPHIQYEYAYTDKYQPKAVKFLKIDMEQVKRTRWPILYEGTVNNYHLFSLAPKGPIYTNEIMHFAILKGNCLITDEQNPDIENKNQREVDNLRWAEIIKDKLVVSEKFSRQ